MPQDYDVPVAKVSGTKITDTDIRSLNEKEWVTDNVIDTYLKILLNELADICKGLCLHLLSSTMETLIRGSRTHRPTYVLNDYKFAVGAYYRSSHWTLVRRGVRKLK
ncbi:hypothetical protein DPMN_158717 [Dreissena polymorpha]|uniref:Uncharacterized protein n=1 Tax=Dreissena polymorpha TaxID=45954 RepID=A0A9D4IQ25_DREPO|nr:hypothetical protein DPMN_158717 [Dreissena polymorpha]